MAFLGIRVQQDVARLISNIEVVGNKEPPSSYHITLLCFEDNFPIHDVAKGLEAAYDVVSKFEPFLVKAKKVSHFPKREDNPIPIIAPIESKELDDLHKKLAKAFDSNKIEFKKTFKDYKPHITLAYSDDEFDDFRIDPPIEFIVNEVVLFGGDAGDDRVFITFPLKGPERTKHSALMRKIDMYEKLAMR